MNEQIMEVITDITGLTSADNKVVLAIFGMFFFVIFIDLITSLVDSLLSIVRKGF